MRKPSTTAKAEAPPVAPRGTLARADAEARLSLFRFATADDRHAYLEILRAFERHRGEIRLSVEQVEAELAQTGAAAPRDLVTALEQLAAWGVLAVSYDAGRVSSIAEYYQRNHLYQLSELGYQAYLAVESVLGHSVEEDVALERYVLRGVLDKLERLAEASRTADAVAVVGLLGELSDALERLSRRARAFYLLLGGLARDPDTDAAGFLELKHQLFEHLEAFLGDVVQYRPRLAEAMAEVEATGVDRLVALAAEADTSLVRDAERRRERWQRCWASIASWFRASSEGAAAPGAPPALSQTDQLERGTSEAISELSRLVRRLTEARRGTLGRNAQLTHLAAWIAGCADDGAARALTAAAFDLRGARHLGTPLADAAEASATDSWWEAAAAPVATTLRTSGKPPSPGRPAPLRDDSAARRRVERAQRARWADERRAVEAFRSAAVLERTLDRHEMALLLTLLERALSTRTAVAARFESRLETRWGRFELRVEPADHDTLVRTHDGTLRLVGMDVTVEAA